MRFFYDDGSLGWDENFDMNSNFCSNLVWTRLILYWRELSGWLLLLIRKILKIKDDFLGSLSIGFPLDNLPLCCLGQFGLFLYMTDVIWICLCGVHIYDIYWDWNVLYRYYWFIKCQIVCLRLDFFDRLLMVILL